MRCQEEDDPPLVPRLGTRTGSTLLFSTTTRFCDMKQKQNYSFLTSRSIAKTSYTIRSSGVLLQTGRVFLMTFIVGVKSYMTKLPINCKLSGLMTFMSNAAGRERDQFGTRMSDWSLGRMPLPFSICGERHALRQKSAMQSLSWLCPVYYIPPIYLFIVVIIIHTHNVKHVHQTKKTHRKD